jgi:hemerythrin
MHLSKADAESVESIIICMPVSKNLTIYCNEEAYIKSIAFPGIETHNEKHKAFISKAGDFYERFTSGKLILSIEVTNVIKEWITHHIKTENKQYAVFAGL